jgi:hypothetical protein
MADWTAGTPPQRRSAFGSLVLASEAVEEPARRLWISDGVCGLPNLKKASANWVGLTVAIVLFATHTDCFDSI